MGGSKGGGGTESSGTSTQQRAPTAEETRLNQLDVQLREATNPYLMETQTTGLKLANQLLSGSAPLPGWMGDLEKGISPDVTRSIVQQSMNDVNAGMAGRGLLDSGTAASVGARTAGDIRRASEEFNIGNRLNMLNLALTGQAQVQQPVLGFSSTLGNRLTTLGQTTQSTSGRTQRYMPSSGGLVW